MLYLYLGMHYDIIVCNHGDKFMTEMASVTLDGINEKDIFLLPLNVFKWIQEPSPTFNGQVNVYEVIPSDVVEYLRKHDTRFVDDLMRDGKPSVQLSVSTYENDRALYLNVCRETSFHGIRDLLRYCSENDIEIVNEYYGGIY